MLAPFLLAAALSAADPAPLASDPQVSTLVAEALASSPEIGRDRRPRPVPRTPGPPSWAPSPTPR